MGIYARILRDSAYHPEGTALKIYLLRHGRTAWNDEFRYQGISDTPLSSEGEAELIPAGFLPDTVYVSPLRRARRTAELLFPGVCQKVIADLAEMNFGVFEGRTAVEMERDSAYRAWVEGGCLGQCPGGEDRASFCERVCDAFVALVERTPDAAPLVIVAHGGVQMAVMERFALPEKSYFSWISPKGGGYVLQRDAKLWTERRKLRYLETVRYTQC